MLLLHPIRLVYCGVCFYLSGCIYFLISFFIFSLTQWSVLISTCVWISSFPSAIEFSFHSIVIRKDVSSFRVTCVKTGFITWHVMWPILEEVPCGPEVTTIPASSPPRGVVVKGVSAGKGKVVVAREGGATGHRMGLGLLVGASASHLFSVLTLHLSLFCGLI